MYCYLVPNYLQVGAVQSIAIACLSVCLSVCLHILKPHVQTSRIFIRITYSGLAQRVECWTCDQQVVGSNPTGGKTLGKLFTLMCFCHQAV